MTLAIDTDDQPAVAPVGAETTPLARLRDEVNRSFTLASVMSDMEGVQPEVRAKVTELLASLTAATGLFAAVEEDYKPREKLERYHELPM